jgi:hypothetical protein
MPGGLPPRTNGVTSGQLSVKTAGHSRTRNALGSFSRWYAADGGTR